MTVFPAQMSAQNTNCATLPALGCLSELPMTSSFSVGSLAALGMGEALDPALQPSRGPENQDPGLPVWEYLHNSLCDRRQGAFICCDQMTCREDGGKTALLLAIRSQDMTLPLRHLCNYSFRCFYFINLHKMLGSLKLCLPASYLGCGVAAFLLCASLA